MANGKITFSQTAWKPSRNFLHGDSLSSGTGVGNETQATDKIASWRTRCGAGKNLLCFAHHSEQLYQMINDLFSTGTAGPYFTNLMATMGKRPERLFMLAGINDIGSWGSSATLSTMQTRYNDVMTRCANFTPAIDVYWLTLLPFDENNSGYYSVANDAIRQSVNTWLTAGSSGANVTVLQPGDPAPAAGTGHRVINLEAWMGNGATPNRRPAAYCYGDGIHLSALGHDRIAQAVAPFVLPEL